MATTGSTATDKAGSSGRPPTTLPWCWSALASWNWTGNAPPRSDSLIANQPPGLDGRTRMVNLRSAQMPSKTTMRHTESAFRRGSMSNPADPACHALWSVWAVPAGQYPPICAAPTSCMVVTERAAACHARRRRNGHAPDRSLWAARVDLTASSPATRIWAICAGSRKVGYPIRVRRSADDTLRGDHADVGRYLR